MPTPEEIVLLMQFAAEHHPRRTQFTFLDDGERESLSLTCAEVDCRARQVAAALQQRTKPGSCVLLFHFSDVDFVVSFFGCLYAGVVAVPVYLPDLRRLNKMLSVFGAIASDCGARLALTTTKTLEMARAGAIAATVDNPLEYLCVDQLDPSLHNLWVRPQLDADTIAFLQYTSGSTGAPKGVINTHGNLMANMEAIRFAFGLTTDSVSVSWLPLYHDMGLIGHVLEPVFCGYRGVLMPPSAFVAKPSRWFAAISRYRGTMCGAPNFAYELCLRKIDPARLQGIDLSSWSQAYSGAEPIRATVMESFAERFACLGLELRSLYTCYGLAEASVFVSGIHSQRPHGISRKTLLADTEYHAQKDSDLRDIIVDCGCPSPNHTVIAVDPATRRQLNANEEGELWYSGPSVAQGYWGKSAISDPHFRAELEPRTNARYLRTGDLGFVRDGHVYVTGRLKELMILNGHNYHPCDIEHTIETSQRGTRIYRSACFAMEVNQRETCVVVQEVSRSGSEPAKQTIQRIRRVVMEAHALPLQRIALIPAGTIPKTSSGKINRALCRDGLLNSTLEVLAMWKEQAEFAAENVHVLRKNTELLPALEQLFRTACPSKCPEQLSLDSSPVYDLGLDSVEVTELLCAVNERFEIQIDYRRLFLGKEDSDAFTINDICELVAEKLSHNSTATLSSAQ